MTSKQAKKAYQKANRVSRVSRAEQRRLDAAELQKQKKEYERERAWAKAKAAREKKASKEKAERETRRKMGIPEPSKYVRASQPTIAMFVRGAGGGKRSWKQMESAAEDSETTMDENEASDKDEAEPPAKRVAVVDDSEETCDDMESSPDAEAQQPASLDTIAEDSKAVLDGEELAERIAKVGTQPPAKAMSIIADDSDDEFGDFPSLSQAEFLERISSSMICSAKPTDNAVGGVIEDVSDLPAMKLPSEEEFPFDDDDDILAAMVTTQILSEAISAASKSDAIEPSAPEISSSPPMQDTGATFNPPHSLAEKSLRSSTSKRQRRAEHRISTPMVRPVLQERSANMPPPRLPNKKAKAIPSAHMPGTSRSYRPGATLRTNAKASAYDPPSAIQDVVSEQIQEVLKDVDDFDLPSNTQIAKELSSPAKSEDPDDYDLPSNSQIARELTCSPVKSAGNPNYADMFCTQDLVLSSQDLIEIATPSRVPPRPQNIQRKSAAVPARSTFDQKKKPQFKRRFFEEKEEDLVQAAIHESIISNTNFPPKNMLKPGLNKTSKHNKEGSEVPTRASRAPFFQEKEEDLYHAAVRESKKVSGPMTIDPQFQKRNLQRRNYSQGYNNASTTCNKATSNKEAVLLPKITTAPQEQKVPIKGFPEKKPRTLARTQSIVTDYGDADFEASFEELAALC